MGARAATRAGHDPRQSARGQQDPRPRARRPPGSGTKNDTETGSPGKSGEDAIEVLGGHEPEAEAETRPGEREQGAFGQHLPDDRPPLDAERPEGGDLAQALR
jgi:hypothetical protein